MCDNNKLLQSLNAAFPPVRWQGMRVLVAVSGGADSVALLHAMTTLRVRPDQILVAHYNHALRGDESDGDEQFVRQLCSQLEVPVEVGRADTAGANSPERREAQARRLRYQFLLGVAKRSVARYVATAHTAEDQAETILHRIVRGTGIAGLTGIPAVRQLTPVTALVRPLLTVSRAEVLSYLQGMGQSHREDSSNRSTAFTRNRIRHELLPHLARHYNPKVAEALVRLGQLAGEAQQAVDDIALPLAAQCTLDRSAQSVRLDRPLLRTRPPYLVREAVKEIWRSQRWPARDMGSVQWTRLSEVITAKGTAMVRLTLPGNVLVTVNEEHVQLCCLSGHGVPRHHKDPVLGVDDDEQDTAHDT